MKIPCWLLGSQCVIFCPCCNLCFRTYAGQPNVCLFEKACSCLDLENNSSGENPDFLGVLFYESTACCIANVQKFAGSFCGHFRLACIKDDRAIFMMVRICLSAIPFWWCAPTPQNVIFCKSLLICYRKQDLANVPLSE